MSLQNALKAGSPLQSALQAGKQALRASDRARITEGANGRVLNSLNLERALEPVLETDKRWDYLLGTTHQDNKVCGVEVHPANTGEARVVIEKKHDAEKALQPHMAPGHSIRSWFWVSSGTNKVTRTTPEWRLLLRAGITMVGSHLALDGEGWGQRR